ncbi:MAG: hypothetical protein WKF50_12030 [Nocardioides sp.]
MSTPVKVVGFVLALVVVFVAARGVGAATGSVGELPMLTADHVPGSHGERDTHTEEAASHTAGGPQVSEQGYAMRVLSQPDADGERPLRFVIDDPTGHVVQLYDLVHEKPLHLISAGRDFSGFQHVHPTLSDDGVWSVDLDLSPGTTRLIADFTPRQGPALVLGTDVDVAGDYAPAEPTPVTRVARVDDYRVELAGDLVSGESSPLTLSVTRHGGPITDLQPYLGAYGHLVALREGDLAYLHVHPEESGPGPEIPFRAEVPSEGRYRLFLDFRHDGVVRTAEFVVSTGSTDVGESDHEH